VAAESTFQPAPFRRYTVGALLVVLDPEGKIISFNRAAEELTGYTAEEVRGKFFGDLFLLPEEIATVKAIMKDMTAGAFPNTHENYWRSRSGGLHWVSWRSTCLTNARGEVEFLIGTGIDLTERRKLEEQLRYDATFDSLTGLFNRRHFMQHLEWAISAAHRYGHPLSLAFCDVDHFKLVNDRHGHLKGDEVLRTIAQVVKDQLRTCDFAGRIGGDEFALVFPHTLAEDAAHALERMRGELQGKSFSAGAAKFTSTVTLGVASLKKTQTEDQLLEAADRALYRGKEAGRDRIELSTGELC
jgi:diguanylate cyclase (GGDEF)-like protein/PAS domain S-box-containing protein